MLIDNTETIKSVLQFDGSRYYYKFAVIARRKDYPEAECSIINKEGRREVCVHQWMVSSMEEVEYRECTPDVRELYDRVRTINVKLKHRKEMIEIAKDLNLTTYHEAEKLTQAFPGWDRYEWNNRNYFEFKAVAQLLRTRVFRSSFRQSLRDQVLVWLDESVNRFERPLSPRQLAMITRR